MHIGEPLNMIVRFLFLFLLCNCAFACDQTQEPLRPKFDIDQNGYIFFCLCMGRLGNQIEHFLGGLAFAKKINRTIVLPPFFTYKNVPFDEWFKPESIMAYHRSILAHDFMENIAPIVWPPESRYGFCYVPPNDPKKSCSVKIGNPFSNFWDGLNVDFSSLIPYDISYYEPNEWNIQFPPDKFPVLALKGAPASFPMWESTSHLQSYIQFSENLLEQVDDLKRIHFNGTNDYVGVHLRNGLDWESTCEYVDKAERLMSSYQCVGFDYKKKLTMEMCLPSVDTVVKLTKSIVEKEAVRYLFVATDKNPLISQFEAALPGVKVVHVDPWLPILDILLLADAKHFIGNCVSSYSAFVWRHRFYHNKGPTSHFGLTEV